MGKIDFSKLETWLHGLLASAIVAGASTGGALLTSYVGQTAVNWHQLGVSIGISSLIAALFYLKQSPLPQDITVKMVTIEPAKTTVTTTTIPQTTDKPADAIDK